MHLLQILMLNREQKRGKDGGGGDESIVGMVLITFWLLDLAMKLSGYSDENAHLNVHRRH